MVFLRLLDGTTAPTGTSPLTRHSEAAVKAQPSHTAYRWGDPATAAGAPDERGVAGGPVGVVLTR